MLQPEPIVASAESVDAAKAYLRIDGDADDEVIASLVASAIAQCEAYVGDIVLERQFVETIAGSAVWTMLSARPARSIVGVADDNGVALVAASFEVDIDISGRGRARVLTAMPQRLRVTYRAGLATSWATIAEPLRHGIVRLVAHHYAYRDRPDESGPPEVVVALWRGQRRMRLI